MKSVWTSFTTRSKIYSVFKVVNDLKVSKYEYIVIKGYEWFNDRLDAIGYSPLPHYRKELMKAIWTHKRNIPDTLIKEIIGNGKETRQNTVYK